MITCVSLWSSCLLNCYVSKIVWWRTTCWWRVWPNKVLLLLLLWIIWLPDLTAFPRVHGRPNRAAEMLTEFRKIGKCADNSVPRRAVGIGHQSLMSALRCTNGAPHLQKTQIKQFLYSKLVFSPWARKGEAVRRWLDAEVHHGRVLLLQHDCVSGSFLSTLHLDSLNEFNPITKEI